MSSIRLGMETIMWIMRLVFVVGVAFLVVFAVSKHNTREIDIKVIEGEMILDRLFYSKDCFAYDDVRTYVGVIDLKKFDVERISKCLDGDYYIKAELADLGYEAYNDKMLYEQNADFCKFENKYYCYEKEIYVVVDDDGVLKRDLLKASLVLPLRVVKQ